MNHENFHDSFEHALFHAKHFAVTWAKKKNYWSPLYAAEHFLNRAKIDGVFGIEGLSPQQTRIDDRSMEYLNTGNTYSLTLVCEDDKLEVTTWGDWYEQAEMDYCEENDVIRCGYCGEFTDCPDGIDWHEIECDSCGHFVDGSGPY